MRLLSPYPMVRIAIPYLIGISLVLWLPSFLFGIWVLPLLLAFLVFILFLSVTQYKSGLFKTAFGAAILIFSLLFGIHRTSTSIETNNADHFSKVDSYDAFIGIVAEQPVKKKNSGKTILEIKNVVINDSLIKSSGKVHAYFKNDTGSSYIQYGDKIIFRAEPAEIDGPPNPGGFDFKRHMKGRNVFHQVFIKPEEWKTIDHDKGNYLIATALQLRQRLINIFDRHEISGKEKAVASALLLGADDDIDQETMDHYAGSGVLHILSVSGMHVGIIYLIIGFTLRLIIRGKGKNTLKVIISLLLIWLYSLISGLSPSVLRAATMFSFIATANLFNRKIPPENSIAASAFVLLIINPIMITNIGFQLSYIAVFGIYFIYNRLNQFWQPQNIFVKYLWQLIAVSFAAQLATSPLSIYYFHQFPLYFMPANLAAMPLSTLAMYSGVALLFFSYIPFLGNALAAVFSYSIQFLNQSVKFFDLLPNAVITNITTSLLQMVILYVIIILSTNYFIARKKSVLKALIIFCIAFAVTVTGTYIVSEYQNVLVISHERFKTSITLISGRNSLTLTDHTGEAGNDVWQQRSLSGLMDQYHVKKNEVYKLSDLDAATAQTDYCQIITSNFLIFRDLRIVIINDNFSLPATAKKFDCDIILLTGSPKLKIKDILEYFNAEHIVADGSNKNYLKKIWSRYCIDQRISFHDTGEKGAFVFNFR